MIFESQMRVRYRETDQMKIAHHGNYLTWFEVGRTDLCRHLGWSYRDIEERGFLLVVTEVSCKYRRPFHYDDLVRVRTRVEAASRRLLRFHYDLLGEDGLRAEGFSVHLWVSAVTRRPVTAPPDLAEAFAHAASSIGGL